MRDINLEDEENIGIGIRRKTDDKLTYKLIIANAINESRRTEGKIVQYPNSVMALANLLRFNIKGYKLKTKIDEVEENLKIEKEKMYEERKNKVPRWKFYKRSYQAKFKLVLDRWYWESFF